LTTSNNNSVQFSVYLRAELNSQWPITESARIQTAAIKTAQDKKNNNKTKKNESAKAFKTETRLTKKYL
jgi:hypothetical protein